MLNFSNKLKEARKKTGLTFDKVAEIANQAPYFSKINKTMLSKWENGKNLPTLENLAVLSEIYKISVDYLIKEHTEHLNALTHLGTVWEVLQENKTSSNDIKNVVNECVLLFTGVDVVFLKGQDGASKLKKVHSTLNNLKTENKTFNKFVEAFNDYYSSRYKELAS